MQRHNLKLKKKKFSKWNEYERNEDKLWVTHHKGKEMIFQHMYGQGEIIF